MSESPFDRAAMAKEYASRHLKTDPHTRLIFFLQGGAPEREIRLVEINDAIVERAQDPFEPLDMGVAIDGDSAHSLLVMDATPDQWEKIQRREIPLPTGWSLDNAVTFSRNGK